MKASDIREGDTLEGEVVGYVDRWDMSDGWLNLRRYDSTMIARVHESWDVPAVRPPRIVNGLTLSDNDITTLRYIADGVPPDCVALARRILAAAGIEDTP